MAVVTYKGGFIRIHEDAVHSYGMTGSAAWRLVDRVASSSATQARMIGPKRSGELVESIETHNPVYTARLRRATAYFAAEADHAQYVIFGTTGPIRPTGAKYLALGKDHGEHPYTYRKSVKGQRKNDFMERSLRHGLRSQGL